MKAPLSTTLKGLFMGGFLSILAACGPTIVGSWGTDCINVDSAQVKGTVTFGESSFNSQTLSYSDSQCATATLSTQIVGTYFEEGASAAVAEATNIQINFNSVTLTPLTAAKAAEFNSSSACGVDTWTENEAVEILDRTCGTTSTQNSQYDIIMAGVGEPDWLRLGKTTTTLDGRTSDTRPTTIDTDVTYHKQ